MPLAKLFSGATITFYRSPLDEMNVNFAYLMVSNEGSFEIRLSFIPLK